MGNKSSKVAPYPDSAPRAPNQGCFRCFFRKRNNRVLPLAVTSDEDLPAEYVTKASASTEDNSASTTDASVSTADASSCTSSEASDSITGASTSSADVLTSTTDVSESASDISESCTTDASASTTDVSKSTTNTSVCTTDISEPTTDASASTTDISESITDASACTSDASASTTDTSVSTTFEAQNPSDERGTEDEDTVNKELDNGRDDDVDGFFDETESHLDDICVRASESVENFDTASLQSAKTPSVSSIEYESDFESESDSDDDQGVIDAENAPTHVDSDEGDKEDLSEGDRVWSGFVRWIEDVEKDNMHSKDEEEMEEEEEEKEEEEEIYDDYEWMAPDELEDGLDYVIEHEKVVGHSYLRRAILNSWFKLFGINIGDFLVMED